PCETIRIQSIRSSRTGRASKGHACPVDDLDRRLLHALQLDGRAPFSRIAAVLGVSDQTIARRFRRLAGTADLRGLGVTDESRLGWQSWIVRLIASFLADGGDLRFEAADVSLDNPSTGRPTVRYRDEAGLHEISCDFVAGCDGDRGMSRESIPDGLLTRYS